MQFRFPPRYDSLPLMDAIMTDFAILFMAGFAVGFIIGRPTIPDKKDEK